MKEGQEKPARIDVILDFPKPTLHYTVYGSVYIKWLKMTYLLS